MKFMAKYVPTFFCDIYAFPLHLVLCTSRKIKGKHISAVFQHLSKKAKELQQKRDIKNTDSIEEMKNFVSHDLKRIQSQQKSLALHISACEVLYFLKENLDFSVLLIMIIHPI